MRPLAFHETWAAILFFGSVGVWSAWEIWLQIRTAGGSRSEGDRNRALLFAISSIGITLGTVLAASADSGFLPGPEWLPLTVGLTVLWAGFIFRAWAVRVLGRFFTCVLGIQEGHHVVDTGPYRHIRHPSYTGIIAVALGIGIATDTWVGLALCALPMGIGFSARCIPEENMLAAQLGQPYRDYMKRTKRLVPGVW